MNTGYEQQPFAGATKRYCRTLDLKNDAALIAEYVSRHAEGAVWPEVCDGIRAIGVLEMEIYRLGNRLFMIVETPLDFDWDAAFARLALLPRQQAWEAYMSVFQQADPDASSAEKWQPMERIFHLYPPKAAAPGDRCTVEETLHNG